MQDAKTAPKTRIAQLSQGDSMPLLTAVDLPDPGPGQLRVRMRAAALNFADLLQLTGRYQATPPRPFVPGLEGAGIVEAAGPGTGTLPGTRVAVEAQGTMAEAGNFAETACLPIPDSMGFEQAAGFQIAYGTSHLALSLRAGLRAGETLAVLGAAGGVGLTAVEIGAAMGARVIAVARGQDKVEVARAAGAHEVIDSDETPDLKAALRALGGVDVVYDPVGAEPGEAAFAALRRGGRFLAIGFAWGRPPELPLNHALVKNLAIHGFYWGGYHEIGPDLLRASMVELFALFDAGKLAPHLGMVLPLDRLDEAYALLETRRSIGKVIIAI